MKKLVAFILLLVTFSVTAQTIRQEKRAIKKAIQIAYVEGLINEGNNTKINLGIHPDCKIMAYDSAYGLRTYTIKEWENNNYIRKRTGTLPKKEQEKVTIKFKHIDITGIAATVKIKYYEGGELTYIGYILMYKFDNDWKMVSKIFNKYLMIENKN